MAKKDKNNPIQSEIVPSTELPSNEVIPTEAVIVSETTTEDQDPFGESYKRANNIPSSAMIFREKKYAPRYFRQHDNIIFTDQVPDEQFNQAAPIWGELITNPFDVEQMEIIEHSRKWIMSKNWRIINVLILCMMSFTLSAQSGAPSSGRPWWIDLIILVVTTAVGLVSRWVEKRFLAKRIIGRVTKMIHKRDPFISDTAIEAAVEDAFKTFSKNGVDHD
jgi:hypothetical protein